MISLPHPTISHLLPVIDDPPSTQPYPSTHLLPVIDDPPSTRLNPSTHLLPVIDDPPPTQPNPSIHLLPVIDDPLPTPSTHLSRIEVPVMNDPGRNDGLVIVMTSGAVIES